MIIITSGNKIILLVPIVGASTTTFEPIKEYLKTIDSQLTENQTNNLNIEWSQFEEKKTTDTDIAYYMMTITYSQMVIMI